MSSVSYLIKIIFPDDGEGSVLFFYLIAVFTVDRNEARY